MNAPAPPDGGPQPPGRRLFGSVRARLVALLVVAALPALGAAVVATIDRIEAGRGEADSQARLAADAVANRFRQRFEGVRGVLTVLSRAPLVRDGATACPEILLAVLKEYESWLANIGVLDEKGTLLCSAVPTAALGQRFDDTPVFREAKAIGGFVIGPIQRGVLTNVDNLPAAQAITRDGRFGGIVSGSIRLDNFLRASDDVPLPAGAAVVIRDEKGARVVALGSPTVAEFTWPAAADRLRVQRASSDQAYRFAVVPIDNDVSVGVAVPTPTWSQLWTREIVAGFGSALLLLALCFAVVFYGTNALVIRPIRALTRAVRGWSGAEREFHPPPMVARAPAELRALSQAFDTAAREIAERGERLAALADQRGLLVREMHHRVKNNLQIVASMLSLQERRAMAEGARGALRAARDRISALVVLHKHLYAEDDLRLVNLRDYLGELAATIHDLLDDHDRDRIRLEIDLPAIRIDIDRAVPLALVVAEVITNAFKYAFPDERPGVVALRCRVFDGDLELTISDDGVGHAEGAEDGGLGAHLMHGFARQLGGRLTTESGDSGTTVRLVFARSVDPRAPAAPQPAAHAGI